MHDLHPATSASTPYDVIISGAGPVGLFLACELRLAGVSVLVLEKAKDPHSPLKRLPFGMRGLSVPTVEAFYRRGLLDDLAAMQLSKSENASVGAHWMKQQRRPGGHFAGIPQIRRPADKPRRIQLKAFHTCKKSYHSYGSRTGSKKRSPSTPPHSATRMSWRSIP